MNDWSLPWEGRSAPPLLTMACHCTGCQRTTGSAISLSAGSAALENFAGLVKEYAEQAKAPVR